MDADQTLAGVSLALRVSPAEAAVGTRTTLTAALTNTGRAPITVNGRMLLNNVTGPGEVWIEVQGPRGYRNMRGFRLRAGQASNEHYVSLAPGASTEQSWELTDYQSLHMPGDYVITVTYHNEIDRAPDGRAVETGRVSASVRIRRHA